MNQNIKAFLDDRVEKYNNPAFIADDPIKIPHLFNRKEDIEISGFLTAILSWGQRKTIINKANQLMQLMDNKPYQFLVSASENDFLRFRSFKHRTFNGDDCHAIINALAEIYRSNSSLEEIFTAGFQKADAFVAINHFSETIFRYPHLDRTHKHLPKPSDGSASKKINMYLRWMIRQDDRGVDFGIWKNIPPSKLICPLDLHSGRMARKLGLLSRNTNDWKAAVELTSKLIEFDPDDPVKYDFALFGSSMYEPNNLFF